MKELITGPLCGFGDLYEDNLVPVAVAFEAESKITET